VIPDKLVMMANQIAANNRHLPDDQAASRVATHLSQFWTPQMRTELEQVAESTAAEAGGVDDPLNPVVRLALARITA
jgi:formate dehydrogenase subunit delta